MTKEELMLKLRDINNAIINDYIALCKNFGITHDIWSKYEMDNNLPAFGNGMKLFGDLVEEIWKDIEIEKQLNKAT